MDIDRIENEYHTIWIENGIIHGSYNPNLKVIDITIAKKLVSDRLKLSNGITRPVLVDTSNAKTINKEAEEYMATGDAMKYLSAAAILVHSRVAKVMASIYISLSRPKIPTKVFIDKAKALVWLEQFKLSKLN